MPENPFRAPRETSDGPSVAGNASTIEPPTYLGEVSVIEGTLEESEAIRMATGCHAVTASAPAVPSKRRPRFASLVPVALVILVTVILFISHGRSGVSSTGLPSTTARIDWFTLLLLVVVPIGLLFAVIWIFRQSNPSLAAADPPLGGKTRFSLYETGCAVETTTRDGRRIEFHAPWQLLSPAASPDAWLFSGALTSPFLVPKAWAESDALRSAVDALCEQIARWRSADAWTVAGDKPNAEMRRSFPDYTLAAEGLTISSVAEKRARRAIAHELVSILPRYVAVGGNRATLAWRSLLVLAALLLAFLLWMTDWSNLPSQAPRLVALALPLTVFVAVGLLLTWASSREIRIRGAISESDIWYDYDRLLLRIPLDSLPVRMLVQGQLVLATDNGSTTIVLPPSSFDDGEAFEKVTRSLCRTVPDPGH